MISLYLRWISVYFLLGASLSDWKNINIHVESGQKQLYRWFSNIFVDVDRVFIKIRKIPVTAQNHDTLKSMLIIYIIFISLCMRKITQYVYSFNVLVCVVLRTRHPSLRLQSLLSETKWHLLRSRQENMLFFLYFV